MSTGSRINNLFSGSSSGGESTSTASKTATFTTQLTPTTSDYDNPMTDGVVRATTATAAPARKNEREGRPPYLHVRLVSKSLCVGQ